MEERLVVSDASPLIGLASAGAFDLIRGLFVRVTITAAVRSEVMAGGELPGARELAAALRDGWIEVAPVFPDGRFATLGAGEASMLALAVRSSRRLSRTHGRTARQGSCEGVRTHRCRGRGRAACRQARRSRVQCAAVLRPYVRSARKPSAPRRHGRSTK